MRAVLITIVLCCCFYYGFTQKAKKIKKNIHPQVMETHFDLMGGLICISKDAAPESKYILDTGAPTLILNEEPEKHSFHGLHLVGVNGSSPIANRKVKDFKLKGLKLGNIRSLLTDLSNLEKIKEAEFEGILGYEVYRHFEIFIDYQRKYLSMFQPGTTDLHAFIKPNKSIQIFKKGHFPVVRVKIGKRYYFFGLDTGAEVNVIDQRLFKRLHKRGVITKSGETSLQGLNKTHLSAHNYRVDEIQLEQMKYEDMEFVFTDLSGFNGDGSFRLDGILGFPFLSSGKFSINIKKRKLYLWNDPLFEANALERVTLLSN